MGAAERTRSVVIAAQCHDHSAWLAGVDFRSFFTDPEVFTKTQLLVSEYYGFDVPNNMWDAYNIEAEALGQKMIYSASAMPDIDHRQPLVDSPAALDRLKPPDPLRSGRMPFVHRVNRLYIERTGRPARCYFCAPFSLAANVRGYVNLVVDMKTRPNFAHRLLAFLCDEVLVPYVQAMRAQAGRPDLGADGVDAWASPPNVSLDLVDEFVLPYVRRLRRALGDRVITTGQWGEARSGDPERFMEQKLEACPISLRVLDPDLWELGPERVRDFARERRVAVTAGLDARLLMDGPAEAIVARIKRYVGVLGSGSRFVVYLNQIPMRTPPEHIHAAVAACRAFGRGLEAEDLDLAQVEVPARESFAEFARRGL